ncbi:hypothetical protein [Kingella potus]|uniref:hypothetical protein n=1 Tax=Kingella potus TaxID=265175 RepID=UPI001FD45450|nr:hypothetical protein [Kingella potus]UOP00875.1 hypothetical protein LVJ84_00050 [Kingella potus]
MVGQPAKAASSAALDVQDGKTLQTVCRFFRCGTAPCPQNGGLIRIRYGRLKRANRVRGCATHPAHGTQAGCAAKAAHAFPAATKQRGRLKTAFRRPLFRCFTAPQRL